MAHTIPIRVGEPRETRDDFDEPMLGGGPLKDHNEVEEIETSKLRQSLDNLTDELKTLFRDMKEVGGFNLKEVTITVEVAAEGKLFLVGKAGAKGAMSLTFTP